MISLLVCVRVGGTGGDWRSSCASVEPAGAGVPARLVPWLATGEHGEEPSLALALPCERLRDRVGGGSASGCRTAISPASAAALSSTSSSVSPLRSRAALSSRPWSWATCRSSSSSTVMLSPLRLGVHAVLTGNRRVPNLWTRTRSDGTTVFEAYGRMGGKQRRLTLKAQTKTDAINELRALQTDYERGETYRSPAAAVSLADLTEEWLQDLEGRTTHRDPKKRRSVRTVTHYRQQVEHHLIPVLGHLPAGEIDLRDVRRFIDVAEGSWHGRRSQASSTSSPGC
jgi:hypothetical protein